jgi:hypothetical protein
MIRQLIALVCLLILYGYVAYTSYGYDDEFSNISLIESGKNYTEIAGTINSMDVHPPGSYLLNKWLFDRVANWSLVRLINAVLAAMSLWLIWRRVAYLSGYAAFSFLVICMNPTLLLWTSGLRWYAYFVPLLNLMLLLLLKNGRDKQLFWGLFFLIASALFYLGYISLVIVPVMFFIALYQRRDELKGELPTIASLSIVSLLICLPQLIVFYKVHLHNGSAQVSGYIGALTGLGLHVFSGQGAYPLTLAGVSMIIGNSLLFLTALQRGKPYFRDIGTQLFVLGAASLLLVRLTAKFRNLVVLSVAQGMAQTIAYGQIRNRLVKLVVVVGILVGNLWGLFNVTTHRNTTKGSWNMPYAEIMKAVKREALNDSTLVLITSDPGIAFHGKKLVPRVVCLVGNNRWAQEIDSSRGPILAFKTFRGSLSQESYHEYLAFIARHSNPTTRVLRFGFDTNAQFKRKFDSDIPDYYADMLVIDRDQGTK